MLTSDETSRLLDAAHAVLDCPLNERLSPHLDRLEKAMLNEREWAWQVLIELYRTLVLAGAGSAERRHRYSFNRRQRGRASQHS